MDERVLRALAQWPNVPDVYGWLSLTARGQWLLRGEPITNPNLIAFINRNYGRANGGYAFQNGPQRVWVTLEYLPWALRRRADGSWERHTGAALGRATGVHIDDRGRLILSDELGPGLVSDDDLAALLTDFTDPQGRPLPDDTLERSLVQAMNAEPTSLHLRLGADLLPVLSLRAATAAATLGFDSSPKAESCAPREAT